MRVIIDIEIETPDYEGSRFKAEIEKLIYYYGGHFANPHERITPYRENLLLSLSGIG